MKPVLPIRIVVPLALGIVASIALAVYAEVAYRRLDLANEQMAVALRLQSALYETLTLVDDAETAQRGFLLTGKEAYLEPYNVAAPKIDSAFGRLREILIANGTTAQRDAVGKVNNLVGKKMAELEATLALYRRDGMEAAQGLISTDIGRRTMDQIRTDIDSLVAGQQKRLDDVATRWAGDIAFARVGMQAMTAVTVALLVVLWVLARRDAERREARRREAQQETVRLEALVEERASALSELSNHLQEVREDEKSKLARDIHDELGGILVSAKMDVAWVRSHLSSRDAESAAKLERALEALDNGVDIKRRIIEQLRPTLLDNLGLSAALDWQLHEVCDRSGLACELSTPEDDAAIPPGVSIALYRILQEGLTNIVKYARATRVQVDLSIAENTVTLLVEDDGVGLPDGAQNNRLSHGIAGMRQRVKALHGDFSIRRAGKRGTLIEVTIPLPPPDASPAPVASESTTA